MGNEMYCELEKFRNKQFLSCNYLLNMLEKCCYLEMFFQHVAKKIPSEYVFYKLC